MKPVVRSALSAMMSLSFTKNMLESMISWDFKEGNPRDNLMQLCFSSLASWLVILLTLIISVLPPEFLPLQVSDATTEGSVLFFFLDGHLINMFVIATAAFVFTWLFRLESLLILVTAFAVKQSWLHINSATAATLATLLSSLCFRWWAVMDIKSEARRVWNSVHQIQMIAFLATLSASLYFLDYLQINGLFSEHSFNRTQFLAALITNYYAVSFLGMALFGHFYFRRKTEPQELPLYFSTANWILRFRFSHDLRTLLKKKAEAEMTKHQDHLKKFNELKKSSPGLSTLPIEKTLLCEIENLKEAILRFSRA